MNQKIRNYFEKIEILLINSQIIENYEIIRQDISDTDGKIRIRANLINKDFLELFEYIELSENKISIQKYHHHWQTKDNKLIRRWDNAPHHKELPNFPHHIHVGNTVKANRITPDIEHVIKTIEQNVTIQ